MDFMRVFLHFVEVRTLTGILAVNVAKRNPSNYNSGLAFHHHITSILPHTPADNVTAEQEAAWMDDVIKLRLPNGKPINIVEVMINRLLYQNPEDQTPTDELKTADKLRSRENLLAPLMQEILHGKADGSIKGRPKRSSSKEKKENLYGAGTMVQQMYRLLGPSSYGPNNDFRPVGIGNESEGSLSIIGDRPKTYYSWMADQGHKTNMGFAWFGSSIVNFWGDCGFPADGMSDNFRWVTIKSNKSKGNKGAEGSIKWIHRRCGDFAHLPGQYNQWKSPTLSSWRKDKYFGKPGVPPDELVSLDSASIDTSASRSSRYSTTSRLIGKSLSPMFPSISPNFPIRRNTGPTTVATRSTSKFYGQKASDSKSEKKTDSSLEKVIPWEKKRSRKQRCKAFFYGVGDRFGTARIDGSPIPNVSDDNDFFDFVVGKNWKSLLGGGRKFSDSSRSDSPRRSAATDSSTKKFKVNFSSSHGKFRFSSPIIGNDNRNDIGSNALTWVGDYMDKYVAEAEAYLLSQEHTEKAFLLSQEHTMSQEHTTMSQEHTTLSPEKKLDNVSTQQNWIKRTPGGLPYNEFPICQNRIPNTDRREVFKPHMLFFHYDNKFLAYQTYLAHQGRKTTFFESIRNLFREQQRLLRDFVKNKKLVRGAIWKTGKKIDRKTGQLVVDERVDSVVDSEKRNSVNEFRISQEGAETDTRISQKGNSSEETEYEDQLDCFVLWAQTAGNETSLQTLTSSFNFLDEIISRNEIIIRNKNASGGTTQSAQLGANKKGPAYWAWLRRGQGSKLNFSLGNDNSSKASLSSEQTRVRSSSEETRVRSSHNFLDDIKGPRDEASIVRNKSRLSSLDFVRNKSNSTILSNSKKNTPSTPRFSLMSNTNSAHSHGESAQIINSAHSRFSNKDYLENMINTAMRLNTAIGDKTQHGDKTRENKNGPIKGGLTRAQHNTALLNKKGPTRGPQYWAWWNRKYNKTLLKSADLKNKY